ncbi:hypothetical protein HBZS_122570 [Helicobacter bizzozeronii CCUG 35545]|nr:hypothetical protein HBZS_122570 [Helicobacter bizzozeronii CCUG 35545]
MNFLYCTEQYYPLQTGTAMADYGLTYALAQAGHCVFVITSDTFNHAGVAMSIKRDGHRESISSGGIHRESIEIAPNLYVIEFHIFHDTQKGWLGELEDYTNFAKNFACDILINASIWTWNSDYLAPFFKDLPSQV